MSKATEAAAKAQAAQNTFLESLLVMFLPTLILMGTTETANLLRQAVKSNKKLFKSAIVAFYPFVDVQLEELAEKTKTPIDDGAVDVIKGAIEIVAAEEKIKLPNLDED